jgi:N-glycosylase/DNA lyase
VEELSYATLQQSDVRYRFPALRARQISASWFVFAQLNGDYIPFLASAGADLQRRALVMSLFPGLGMKQSSMLLRDIGIGRSLAVIDTHVLWYLEKAHEIRVKVLSPANYLRLEDVLQREAAHLGVEMSDLDAVIWSSVKAMKGRPEYV